ncbi:MAG: PEP-CTERM sorting domain-containing protein [Armatimonadetes bacterium]|nr:PEP-CTERM sorting domain-containing protein [Armatimonadota bacterium]
MRALVGLAVLVAASAHAQFAAHGISASDPSFTGWATGVNNLTRGPMNIANPSLGLASYGSASDALGAPGGWSDVVSLGDGGSITVTFDQPITDGPGDDFAVFENGFATGGNVFAELGFVEVSSNGTDFFRFQSTSLTQTTTQLGAFASLDPTKVHNLAGQFPELEGTPFDLSELSGVSSLLDVNAVRYVRVVDVVGSIDDAYATYDSFGHKINDPWSTPFASGGFDLDAVGVIHAVPEPGSLTAVALGLTLILRRRKR